MTNKLPIAVLISGGGSTLKNILDRSQQAQLNVDVKIVVSSRADAKGLEYARAANIPTMVLRKSSYPTAEEFRDTVFDAVRSHNASYVVMGGYLQHLLIPPDFENRVVNIHPSLIPAFCGQGYYGLAVHQAAVQYGVRFSGCTVHFVDNQYDHGPIIAQAVCDVAQDDTPESLQARVGVLERELLPEVLQAISESRVSVDANSRRVKIFD